MSLFNYIDTFFFISLGITFVLILLLVFHFKSLILNLEKKNDTMFEIINNIVTELNYMKNNSIQNHPMHFASDSMGGLGNISKMFSAMNNFSDINDNGIDLKPITIHLNQAHPDLEEIDDNVVTHIHSTSHHDDDDDDDEDDDEDDAVDDDDEDDDDSDSDDEDDEPSLNKTISIIKENVTSVNIGDMVELVSTNKDDKTEDSDDSEEGEIKIVNVPIGNVYHASSTTVDILDTHNVSQSNKITVPDEFELTESIHFDYAKKDTDVDAEVANNESNGEDDINIEGLPELIPDYNVMTVTELRAIVTTKHLASNPSKLKKNELIQLLQK